ncbi:MAG TPA: pyridoxamine 5'-phosphate oxidase family protein [Tepidisphaeraceae bacterium]|jgi:pyridoxamine 5'-phosphate oxidase|nr:pyridoxamine 5'-phosphate oxidase family protein [Tepidisphaeraceae bacterium]
MEWLTEFRRVAGDVAGGRPLVATIATVDAGCSPRARSVVVRHIGDDGSIWFVSDARSAKNAQLAADNDAEIMVWLPEAREQFRLFGTVDRLGPALTGTRMDIWRQMSDASRALFFWPAPGTPRTQDDAAFPATVDAATAPPVTFEVLFLEPLQVEHLRLLTHPHQRRRWRSDTGWEREELNP